MKHSLILLALMLSGTAASASSAKLNIEVYGTDAHVRADAFGRNVPTDLVIDADDTSVDFFAAPCAREGRSRTVLRNSGQRRVIVAPCP
jgi:hypothetical protein